MCVVKGEVLCGEEDVVCVVKGEVLCGGEDVVCVVKGGGVVWRGGCSVCGEEGGWWVGVVKRKGEGGGCVVKGEGESV